MMLLLSSAFFAHGQQQADEWWVVVPFAGGAVALQFVHLSLGKIIQFNYFSYKLKEEMIIAVVERRWDWLSD